MKHIRTLIEIAAVLFGIALFFFIVSEPTPGSVFDNALICILSKLVAGVVLVSMVESFIKKTCK